MRLFLLIGAACALLLGACGGDEPAKPATPVRLQVIAPQDLGTVRTASVEGSRNRDAGERDGDGAW